MKSNFKPLLLSVLLSLLFSVSVSPAMAQDPGLAETKGTEIITEAPRQAYVTILVALGLLTGLAVMVVRSRKEVAIAQAALEEHVEQTRLILENISCVITRWTPDLDLVSINDYGAELFGYTPQELAGKPMLGTIVIDNEASRASLLGVAANIVRDPQEYVNVEGRNRTRSGEVRWMIWTNSAITDADGNLKEILGVGTDITERKMLQVELHEAYAIIKDQHG